MIKNEDEINRTWKSGGCQVARHNPGVQNANKRVARCTYTIWCESRYATEYAEFVCHETIENC